MGTNMISCCIHAGLQIKSANKSVGLAYKGFVFVAPTSEREDVIACCGLTLDD